MLRELGISVVVPAGLEADDVLASCAEHARVSGGQTVVVTSDRDAFALIDDSTRVLRIINGGVDASPLMTADRLVLLLGVRPEQYRDFAALRGDPSDNLPGVRGIGPRTAARLLAEFGTAEAAFADLDAVRTAFGPAGPQARRPRRLRNWQRNCQVMTMRRDVASNPARCRSTPAGGSRLPGPAADLDGERRRPGARRGRPARRPGTGLDRRRLGARARLVRAGAVAEAAPAQAPPWPS